MLTLSFVTPFPLASCSRTHPNSRNSGIFPASFPQMAALSPPRNLILWDLSSPKPK
uniref:Uncharacterized protein n=1 Tax=Picea glauca TaxID=3330 RepID=A0A101LUX7_PICGL|nr:hypothetical protein ABT39_MTgene2380 [Picea glauca]